MLTAADHEAAAMLARFADAVVVAVGGRPRPESECLMDLDAVALLAAYAEGSLAPGDVVAASVERIAELDPAIGAMWATDEGAAFAAAERSAARWASGHARPLEGVPIVIKDLLDTHDLVTTGGSKWLTNRRPASDAAVVAAVRAAGAVVLGKTATFELGCGDEQTPFGTVRNPSNLAHTTGGSSAGSAAALAAGYAPLAIGTDTGGSIRLPASYCGVVGLKPTLGRLSCAGLIGLAPTLDTPGPMARTARDVQLLLGAMEGERSVASAAHAARPVGELVVGVARRWFCDVLADDVAAAFERAVAQLGGLVAKVTDVDLALAEHGPTLSWLITMYEASITYRNAPRDQLTPAFVGRLEVGDRISAEQYAAALRARREMIAQVSTVFARCDVVVVPSAVSTAPPLDDIERPVAGRDVTWPDVLARTVALWNVTGLPAVSVPVGFGDDGLPIGIQVVGPAFGDETCLTAAAALQSAAGALAPDRNVR